MKQVAAIFVGFGCIAGCQPTVQPTDARWIELFDGQSLAGWTIVNGDDPFEVRDGEIVGATVMNTPTRYLTTTRSFSDFILELEVNNSAGDNSGVQFRSTASAPFYTGLTGPQLEVDPSDRKWTGGIYFEGLGQWRHPIIADFNCKSAWKPEGWNSLRIETRGVESRTFVNDVPCAYVLDEPLTKGAIGLQAHSIGDDLNKNGKETRWRSIRILENPKSGDYTPADTSADIRSWLVGRLAPAELTQGWQLVAHDDFSDAEWSMDEIVNPIDESIIKTAVLTLGSASIASKTDFTLPAEDYHLIADFQIDAASSGEIRYRVETCELSFRLFDDTSLTEPDPHSANTIGSLTGIIAAANLSETVIGKRVLHPDSWQRAEIVIQNDHVEHWLNSVKVVEFDGCPDTSNAPDQSVQTSDTSLLVIAVERGGLRFHTIKFKPL